jgi:hypothetical protein
VARRGGRGSGHSALEGESTADGEARQLNLIVDSIPRREYWLWVDEPPPEKSPELGIGRHVAWQTPLHREAVRRLLRPS